METAIIVACSMIAAVIMILSAMLAATSADTKAAYTTIDAISRNPEQKTTFLTTMLISIGLIESIPVITAVIAIVLVIANPFV